MTSVRAQEIATHAMRSVSTQNIFTGFGTPLLKNLGYSTAECARFSFADLDLRGRELHLRFHQAKANYLQAIHNGRPAASPTAWARPEVAAFAPTVVEQPAADKRACR